MSKVAMAKSLNVPKAEPGTEEGVEPQGGKVFKHQLIVPKRENETSPKCVLSPKVVDLSSSSEDSSVNESEGVNSSGASSDSDEEEYKICSDEDGEEEDDGEEEERPPQAKKRKHADADDEEEEEEEEKGRPSQATKQKLSGESTQKKSKVKITAKRDDCRATKVRNSDPGRRRVGSRIYDSKLGKTCHWCRQKTVELHVECTLCPIRFCGACLHNRNGETIEQEMLVRWTCPKCRGGCGRGCKNCCNCGPCRKAQGLEVTGQLVNKARQAGFSNVHDFLVHLKTKESPEEIALRKKGKNWTRDSGAPLHSALMRKKVKEEVEEVEEEFEKQTVKEEAKEVEEEFDKNEVEEEEEEEEEEVKNEAVKGAELYGKRLEGQGVKVKDEPVYVYDKPQQEKISEDPRIIESVCHTPESDCKATNSLVHTSISEDPSENAKLEKSLHDDVSHGGTPSCMQGSDFGMRLEAILQRPFSKVQMKEMWEHVNFRKPVMKLRQTRSGAIEVPGSVEGLSYLDHYPDLKEKLAKAKSPEKLRLLRGFLFWLQHSCMEGSYRPWRDAPTIDDSGDCMEISGPDCERTRVLLTIDEDEDTATPEWKDTKPVARPAVVKKLLFPKQAVSRFPVKVKQEKED